MTDLPAPLAEFCDSMADAIGQFDDTSLLLDAGRQALQRLLLSDDWLPDAMAVAQEGGYQQHLLYLDPVSRFSVVSFVWGPGQGTPIHDHCTWGLIGVLRGLEMSQAYERLPSGALVEVGALIEGRPGAVEAVSPEVGDIHRVWNGLEDTATISIHVYGGDIGSIDRHVFSLDGTVKPFRSGYSSRLQAH
ncbi:MAG: cysteine dioxygenase [Novosphingobium sp.]